MGDTFYDIKSQRMLSNEQVKHPSNGFGFDPAELIAHGVLSNLTDIPFDNRHSTLDNDILPLFKFEDWDFQRRDIYEVLKPALRLASLFLSHKATSSFWHTICFGTRIQVLDSIGESIPCGHHNILQICVPYAVPWSPSGEERFSNILARRAAVTTFRFDEELGKGIERCYGEYVCGFWYKNTAISKQYRDLPGHHNFISLCTDVYASAKRIKALKPPDPDAVLRFNWCVTLFLLHEIARKSSISSLIPPPGVLSSPKNLKNK